MADEIKTVIEPVVTPAVTPTRTDILRDLSKEYGINLFDAKGVDEFKKFQEAQKTEQQKLTEQVKTYEAEKNAWSTEKLNYESKLEAIKLGIHPDYTEDALKLAGGDPTKLADVIKKYPIFKSKDGIKIGLTNPTQTTPPSGNSEVEAYMAADPRYRKYNKTKK